VFRFEFFRKVIRQQYVRAALFTVNTSAGHFSSNLGQPNHFIQSFYRAFAR
jgi:hypothetical protein